MKRRKLKASEFAAALDSAKTSNLAEDESFAVDTVGKKQKKSPCSEDVPAKVEEVDAEGEPGA